MSCVNSILFKCTFCANYFKSKMALKRHVFSHHCYDKSFKLICNIDGCSIQLNDKVSLRHHIKRWHCGKSWHMPTCWYRYSSRNSSCDLEELSLPNDTPKEEEMDSGSDCNTTCSVATSEDSCIDKDIDVYRNTRQNLHNRKQLMALSLTKLKVDCNLTESALHLVQTWTEGLLEESIQTLIGGIKATASLSSSQEEVFQLAMGLANPFHDIVTEYQRRKLLPSLVVSLFCKHCISLSKVLVQTPTRHILFECPKDGSKQGMEYHSLEYISLTALLKTLLENSSLYDWITKSEEDLDDEDVYKSFSHGEYAKSHSLFTEAVPNLQLLFYYDGFEVVNPLGSKTGTHNMGAIYFLILNTHPKLASAVNRIFLSTLFYSKDLKDPRIGWVKILQPLNRDIQQLETEGVHFSYNGSEVTVRGTVAQIALDNLAAHSILGFTERFSGFNTFVSRYCTCTGNDIQTKNSYKQCQIRTREMYNNSVEVAQTTGKPHQGIKFRCPLLSQYFHPAENFAADVHHDIFEGAIPYILKLTLQNLIIKKKLFSLDCLNNKIDCFKYGMDHKNKPSHISYGKLVDDKSKNLRQTASQYWCLLRCLPMLIGSYIPDEDDAWELYITFCGIVDICCAPFISCTTITELEMELRSFFSMFHGSYPEAAITPKLHFLLHYPRLIKEIGPLMQFSCMRFEAKHKSLKQIITRSNNYINVPHTIAVQHQIKLASNIIENDLFSCPFTIKTFTTVNSYDVFGSSSSPTDETYIKKTDNLSYDGLMYSAQCVVCAHVCEDGVPDLLSVDAVYLSQSCGVILVGHMLCVNYYNEHYHAWSVEHTSVKAYVLQKKLCYPHPLCVVSPFGLFEKFVCPKFRLESLKYSACVYLS